MNPTWKARTAIVAMATVGALVGISAPASAALPPLKIANASGSLCLSADTDAALRVAGIELAAVAPATLTTTEDGRRCVNITLQGTISLDAQDGQVTVDGGIAFTNTVTGARVRFTDIAADVKTCAQKKCVATAKVNDGATSIDWLTLTMSEASIRPNPVTVSIEAEAPLRITSAGVGALADTFGSSPIAAESVLFDATGQAKLGPTAIGVITGLITGLVQPSAPH